MQVIRLAPPGPLYGLHHSGLSVHPPLPPQGAVTVVRPGQPLPDDGRFDGTPVKAHRLLHIALVPVLGDLDLVVEVLVLRAGREDQTIALTLGPAGH